MSRPDALEFFCCSLQAKISFFEDRQFNNYLIVSKSVISILFWFPLSLKDFGRLLSHCYCIGFVNSLSTSPNLFHWLDHPYCCLHRLLIWYFYISVLCHYLLYLLKVLVFLVKVSFFLILSCFCTVSLSGNMNYDFIMNKRRISDL